MHVSGEPHQVGARHFGKPHPGQQCGHQARELETEPQPARSRVAVSQPRSVSTATSRCTVGIGSPRASEISFERARARPTANIQDVQPAGERPD